MAIFNDMFDDEAELKPAAYSQFEKFLESQNLYPLNTYPIEDDGRIKKLTDEKGHDITGVYELNDEGKGVVMDFRKGETLYWAEDYGVVNVVKNDWERQKPYKEQYHYDRPLIADYDKDLGELWGEVGKRELKIKHAFEEMAKGQGLWVNATISKNGRVYFVDNEWGDTCGVYELRSDGKGVLMNFETKQTIYWTADDGIVKVIENDRARQKEYRTADSDRDMKPLIKAPLYQELPQVKEPVKEEPKPNLTESTLRQQFAKLAKDQGLDCKAEISRDGKVHWITSKEGRSVAGVYELRPDGKGVLMNFDTGQTTYWEANKGIVKVFNGDWKRQEQYRTKEKLPPLIKEPLKEQIIPLPLERTKKMGLSR
jgi:hypothetical protein